MVCGMRSGYRTMGRGRLHSGPRRLMMETCTPCPQADRERRKGAALACCAAEGGRNNMNSMSVCWAARCSRRSEAERSLSTQQSRAEQALCLRICSAAQSVSLEVFGWIHKGR